MSTDKVQSAILEMRDQLFLDTADSLRLNIVSANLGLDRPIGSLGDDEWRAAAKEIALRRKLVLPIYHRVIEVCLGPQKSRIGVLSETAEVGDTVITLDDASNLLQLGSIVLSEGTANEETVEFCFRDLFTNQVFLTSPLAFQHEVLDAASSFLTADVAASAVALPVLDSRIFPTSGFPYNVILDRGTEFEETVEITANTVATNTLTCSATTFAHSGPVAQFVRKPLEQDTIAGRTFLVLDANDTRVYPAAGFVRLAFGTGTEEIAEYIENDVTNDVLTLKRPLQFAHSMGESVELMSSGAAVETVSAKQAGTGWDVFITNPREVQVYVPEDLEMLRLTDASWLHKEAPASPGSTTTSAAVSIGDTSIPVTSVRGFVDEGDLIDIDTGAETAWYIRRDSGDPVEISQNSEPFALSDGQTLTVSVDGAAADTATFNIADFADIANATAVEIAAVINTDVADCHADATADGRVRITSDDWPDDITASIEVTGGTANPTIGFLTPALELAQPLTVAHGGGVDVDATQIIYGGTTLEDGNIRNAGGSVITGQFPGPYLYDPSQEGVTDTTADLAIAVPFPTRVAVSQVVGATCLEVEDVSSWLAPPFTPFTVRIGRASGTQEDRTVTDRTLQTDASTTVDSGTLIGDTSIDGVDTTDFPESDGVNPARYRIIIDQGNANEEIVTVVQNTAGTPGTFSLLSPMTIAHSAAETIELLNDVLTFDVLTESHTGVSVTPTVAGDRVEPLVESIELSSVVGFPDEGTVWVNFGKERINVRARITSVVSPTILEFADSSLFPTTDFPYRIVVGEGLPQEEIAFVSANNTGLNQLTMSSALVGTFAVGDYVEFTAGTPTVLDYNDIDSTTLNLTTPQVLSSGFTEGEVVTLSPGPSAPDIDGNDFPFLMPANPAACVELLLEFVRAAGVEIVFLTDR